MRIKIDNNIKAIAAVKGEDVSKVARELCDKYIASGLVDPEDNWGDTLAYATRKERVSDVCRVFSTYMWGEVRPLTEALFSSLCALVLLGDGPCPICGGSIALDDVEGHELDDGDRYTPPSYVVDAYVYRCQECGEYFRRTSRIENINNII